MSVYVLPFSFVEAATGLVVGAPASRGRLNSHPGSGLLIFVLVSLASILPFSSTGVIHVHVHGIAPPVLPPGPDVGSLVRHYPVFSSPGGSKSLVLDVVVVRAPVLLAGPSVHAVLLANLASGIRSVVLAVVFTLPASVVVVGTTAAPSASLRLL